MKKITKQLIGILLILAILVAICPKANATVVPSLQDIANVFNVHGTVKSYNSNNETMNLSASATESSLIINVTNITTPDVIEYELQANNVLILNYNEGDATKIETRSIVTKIVVDSIQRYYNRVEGEMFDTMESSEISSYTIEKDGLRILKQPNVYVAEISIATRIPTVNTDNDTNKVIKVSDLTEQKENIIGDGNAKLSKGNILFYKNTKNGIDHVVIAEKSEFTYATYKSLIAALTVLFESNNDAIEYFKTNYPGISVGNKQFEGFKVEINPVRTSEEDVAMEADESYQFVRLTINRDDVKEAIKEEKEQKAAAESASTTTGTASSTTTSPKSDTLPKTGGEVNPSLIALYTIMAIAGLSIIVLAANSKKGK